MKKVYKPLNPKCHKKAHLDCRNCRNYQKCLAKKMKRKIEKVLYISCAVIFILCCINVCAIAKNTKAEQEKNSRTVVNQVCMLSYQIDEVSEKSKETEEEKECFTTEPTEEVEETTEEVEILTEEEHFEEIETTEEEYLMAVIQDDKYHINDSDLEALLKLVYQEARGECFDGKVAVAAVVLNRYVSGDARFDRSSVYSVIVQPGQFANISSVTIWQVDQIPEIREAVEAALRGMDPTRDVFEDGAKFFYNPKGVSGYQAQIRQGIEIMTIGNHNFHNDFND